MDIINIRKISDAQAKKEIVEYLSRFSDRCFDASNIQTDLSIDISQAITILDELEKEGKIKGGTYKEREDDWQYDPEIHKMIAKIADVA